MVGTAVPGHCSPRSPCRPLCHCGQKACSVPRAASFSNGIGAKTCPTSNSNCVGVTQGKTVKIVRQKNGISDVTSTGFAACGGRLLVILSRRARWDWLVLRRSHAAFVSRLVIGPSARESPVATAARLYTVTGHSRASVSAGTRVRNRLAEMPVPLFHRETRPFWGVGFKSVDTHLPSFQPTLCLLTAEKSRVLHLPPPSGARLRAGHPCAPPDLWLVPPGPLAPR